jgi:hypothetical protein
MKPARAYAALLALYPRAFRETYGDEMLDTFREWHRTSRLPAISFWRVAIADLGQSVCRAQLDACRSGPRRFVLRWLAVCALGIIGTGFIASLVTWSFAYLYHPYLEGLQLAPWSYGAFLGVGLGIAQSAALRHGPRTALSWIAASAASGALGLHLAAMVPSAIGPVGGGIVVGTVVGGCQWMMTGPAQRRRSRGWPMVASALSLTIAVIVFDAWTRRALGGMNPVVADFQGTATPADYNTAIIALIRGLRQPRGWMDFAFELAVMSLSGLTVGSITARRLSQERRAR